jgi:hypothetical protein
MLGELERRGGQGRRGEMLTTRFTSLTCDAAARAGERAEKKELSLLYFRQRQQWPKNDMFLHVIEAKLDPAHARRPAYSSHIQP